MIIAIGDSHSQIFDNGDAYPVFGKWIDQNLNDKFIVKWLGPLTLHRIVRDGFESFNEFKEIQPNQKCILSLGEIDCRQHTNFQSKEQNLPYTKIIDNLVDGLKKRLIEFKYKSFDFHLLSIVPAVKKSDSKEPETLIDDDLRKEYVIYFNNKYRELCEELGIKFVDQYNILVAEDGFINKNEFDGLIHGIKTQKLETYLKKTLNI